MRMMKILFPGIVVSSTTITGCGTTTNVQQDAKSYGSQIKERIQNLMIAEDMYIQKRCQ